MGSIPVRVTKNEGTLAECPFVFAYLYGQEHPSKERALRVLFELACGEFGVLIPVTRKKQASQGGACFFLLILSEDRWKFSEHRGENFVKSSELCEVTSIPVRVTRKNKHREAVLVFFC